MSALTRLGMVFGLLLLLTACGDGDQAFKDAYEGTIDETTTEEDQTTTDETVAAIYLGSGSGTSFTAGVLDVALDSISAGGSTSVSASLADENGNLYQEAAIVTFTSVCSSQGWATLDSPIVASGGIASTTYTATGCAGEDTITAASTVNDITLTASGTVTVQPADVGSLHFVSAEPELIGIKGTGLNEVAIVQFKVLDTNGNPVIGEGVSFSLDTTIGGITLDPTSASSDINGLVQTYVQSGTVSTTVKVTAVLDSNAAIKTQSDGLVISTGIADQNSFSISASVLNPEAWDYDGEEVEINILAADHFNNPVAKGTAIYFTTEGGQIDSQCEIGDFGGCSVTWRSSDPRPDNGRATILATAIGEESFADANANGVLDDPPDSYHDIGEAFRDDDEDGSFDPTEELRELDGNGSYDGPDGEFNGVLCDLEGDPDINVTNVCSSTKNTYVRDSIVLVMSAPVSYVDFRDDPDDELSSVSSLDCHNETIDSVYVVYSDFHAQPPPAGTKINVKTSNGTLESAATLTVQSTNYDGALAFNVRVSGDSETSSGTLTVTFETLKGLITTAYLTVND